MQPKVAIIGSGISGLGATHALTGHAQVSLFEAGAYFGGHSHTVDISLPTASGMQTAGVDTGFLVFNERTYPNLIALFDELQVATAPSDMSFSVQAKDGERDLEWSGASLNAVFAQRRNLLAPRFLGMLLELVRLNRVCTKLAQRGEEAQLRQPLADFLSEHRFSKELRDWYLLPMLGCIWSCPTQQMLRFPVATMIRFCHNHGLLQLSNRPKWWTVQGGSRNYVEKITAQISDKRLGTRVHLIERDQQGVRVITQGQAERFDHAIVATHAPQALAMLRDPSDLEREILGHFRTQANRLVLHTDAAVLPKNPLTWSAWNYARGDGAQESNQVCLHYLLNKLQPIPFAQPVIASLNPNRSIAGESILGEYEYAHPVMDLPATAAQARLPQINGVQHTWFCGAWTRYGFHEDGLLSGLAAAREILRRIHGATP